MSEYDTPEHAAYRAVILAYGTEDLERVRLEHENAELRVQVDELEREVDRLGDEVWELEQTIQAS